MRGNPTKQAGDGSTMENINTNLYALVVGGVNFCHFFKFEINKNRLSKFKCKGKTGPLSTELGGAGGVG